MSRARPVVIYPWDANQKFRELATKLIYDLGDSISFRKPSGACNCDLHQIGSIYIEHPNIHKHWGCCVRLFMGYVAAENDDDIIFVDPRKEIIPEALDKIKKLELNLHECVAFGMLSHRERIITTAQKSCLIFNYDGPSDHPVLSQDRFNGGDEFYRGNSAEAYGAWYTRWPKEKK